MERKVRHELFVRRSPHGQWLPEPLDADFLTDLACDLLDLREQAVTRGEDFGVFTLHFTPGGVQDLRFAAGPPGQRA